MVLLLIYIPKGCRSGGRHPLPQTSLLWHADQSPCTCRRVCAMGQPVLQQQQWPFPLMAFETTFPNAYGLFSSMSSLTSSWCGDDVMPFQDVWKHAGQGLTISCINIPRFLLHPQAPHVSFPLVSVFRKQDCLFPRTVMTNYHKLGVLFPYSSGLQSLEIKVSADLVPPGDIEWESDSCFSLSFWVASNPWCSLVYRCLFQSLPLSSHGVLLCVSVSPNFPFLIRIPFTRFWGLPW